MPSIRCHYTGCVFIDDGYCSAAVVEIDPDTGCATYTPTDGAAASEEKWDEEELEEWEEEDIDEEDDDLWADDEEEEY